MNTSEKHFETAGELLNTLGRRIQFARELKGITQRDLCNILAAMGRPIDMSYLSLLENDKREPSLRTLGAIAVALNVDGVYLLNPIIEAYNNASSRTDKHRPLNPLSLDPVLLDILLKSQKSLRFGLASVINDAIDISKQHSETDMQNGN